ncbi:hypothetical protein [Sphingosinicella sp. CPCC 101087]|uniref:hypothetical protein n=1 Tax=Sphingosinicella sp. CPCC 101087 TaxID=2497754 RepID=UPI00101D47C4|nr:hypothetical protein [Sphingosinicella sp. CPCC 101087]
MRIPAALLVASIILGAAYYSYLVWVSFPPAAARIVPFAWLVLAATSFGLSLRQWRRSGRDSTTAMLLVLSSLSGLIAAPFAMAAVLGG